LSTRPQADALTGPAPRSAHDMGRSWEERWRELVLGRSGGPGAAAARAGLWALSGLYGGVISAYRAAYDLGLFRTVTAECRIVSVGNLTVGGTGKSTAVRWLARHFRERGARVAVLSYGYRVPHAGTLPEEAVTVVSDGEQILVPEAESGDEPRMLAEALPGVPVLIGKRRQLSAAEAVRRFGAQVCVLDDAFQYWRLVKDLELVLIDARCPFGGGHLLPRGLLREPLRALRRASVVIVTNGHELLERERAALRSRLRSLNPDALLAEARHAVSELRPLATDMGPAASPPLASDASALGGRRVLALSSLGNPEGFERTLAGLGAEVASARFPDHHHYQPHELQREVERARAAGCAAIVTTEKDAVKINASWVGVFPVWVLAVELAFDHGREELEARLDRLVPQG
jgi:tetraacyldisaccharide-1-P 4'-kinase